jgi:hypothetical protein
MVGSVTSDTTFNIIPYLSGYIGVTASGVAGYNDPNVLIGTVTGTVNTPDGGTSMMLLESALMDSVLSNANCRPNRQINL